MIWTFNSCICPYPPLVSKFNNIAGPTLVESRGAHEGNTSQLRRLLRRNWTFAKTWSATVLALFAKTPTSTQSNGTDRQAPVLALSCQHKRCENGISLIWGQYYNRLPRTRHRRAKRFPTSEYVIDRTCLSWNLEVPDWSTTKKQPMTTQK